MMNINSFDKDNLRLLRQRVDDALAPIAKEMGITISMGAIRFEAFEARAKITFSIAHQKVDLSKLFPNAQIGSATNSEDEDGEGEDENGDQNSRISKYANDFKNHLSFLGYRGFKSEHLGATFHSHGRVYRLEGYRPTAHKNSFVVSRQGSKRLFVLDEQRVRSGLGI